MMDWRDFEMQQGICTKYTDEMQLDISDIDYMPVRHHCWQSMYNGLGKMQIRLFSSTASSNRDYGILKATWNFKNDIIVL